MNICYLFYEKEERNTAGFKAPDDIYAILRREGYAKIDMPAFPSKRNWLYKKVWLLTKGVDAWRKVCRTVPDGAVIVYQHPSYGIRLTHHYVSKLQSTKGCKFIAIIHDLESLRGGIDGVVSKNKHTNQIGDNELLKKFDMVICHNQHMRYYLIGQGFDPSKVINLEIFDYLTEVERNQSEKESTPSIAIAGNLAIGKSAYIYKIFEHGNNSGLKVNLYGVNYDDKKSNERMIYHGSFKPEELPEVLEGDFGLVWDGNSADTCAGNTGEYLKYNNPHKTSLYLASGMPVIVWSQAAIADFVIKNGVGIAVDSLKDIEASIREINASLYKEMCSNAARVADQLRSGYYTKSAIEQAIE